MSQLYEVEMKYLTSQAIEHTLGSLIILDGVLRAFLHLQPSLPHCISHKPPVISTLFIYPHITRAWSLYALPFTTVASHRQ